MREIVKQLFEILDAHVKGGGLILEKGWPAPWTGVELEGGVKLTRDRGHDRWAHYIPGDKTPDGELRASLESRYELLDRRPLNLVYGVVSGQDADAAPAELDVRSAPVSPFRVIEVGDGRFEVSVSGLYDKPDLACLYDAIGRALMPGRTVARPKDDGDWLKGGDE